MKKAIVLLLALAVLGGAVFAQANVKVALSGAVTIIDQDQNGVFAPDGNGYDTLTITATKDNFGFSMTDQNILTGGIELRDWNVWYQLFDKKAKVTFGNLRNGDFRMLLPNAVAANLAATDRITGQGMLLQAYPMDGLTLGVNLPYGLTAEATADVFQKLDLGAKYVIADVGTVILLANLKATTAATDIVPVGEYTLVNFGFTFSAVENLTATVLYKGYFGDETAHKFGLGLGYTMDALSVGAEFAGAYTTELAWDLALTAGYDITDAIYAGADFAFDSDSAYDVSAYVGYNFGAGLKVEAGFGYNEEVYYSLKAKYAIAF